MSDDTAKEVTPQALQTEAGASAGGGGPEKEVVTQNRERGGILRKVAKMIGALLFLRVKSGKESLQQAFDQANVPQGLRAEMTDADVVPIRSAPSAESSTPAATTPDKAAA